jgi:hypothetical protein
MTTQRDDTQHNDTQHNGRASSCSESFMQSGIHAECSVSYTLTVTCKVFVLSVVMPNVIILSVVALLVTSHQYNAFVQWLQTLSFSILFSVIVRNDKSPLKQKRKKIVSNFFCEKNSSFSSQFRLNLSFLLFKQFV